MFNSGVPDTLKNPKGMGSFLYEVQINGRNKKS